MQTTNTKKVMASIRGLLCISVVTLAACSPDKNSPTFRLQLLHTNDMHSFFEEFNNVGMPCDGDEHCYGGFPRLKNVIDDMLNKVKSNPNIGSLVLNAGDTFQGTVFYSEFKWKIVADLLPKLGIDVMCFGNHEFDDGVSDVVSFLEKINVPVVVSNLDLSEEPSLASQPNLTKSTIVEVKDRKIGIIGYLTPDTAAMATVGNVKFKDEIMSIREEARRLKDDGIKIIIALGHSGFEMDQKIAREVEEVDVVVGGHTHTFLYSGNPPDNSKAAGAYPFCVTQPRTEKQVPVVQAYHHTKYLGQLWVDFNEDGEVLNSFGNPILMNSDFEQDADLLKDVYKYKVKVDEKTKKVIGQTSVLLEGNGRFCRLRECNFGNFIADAYVDYNAQYNTTDYDQNDSWTDAPIALQHSGGIRADIDSSSDSGNITYGQLIKVLPFSNIMGKVELSGLEIKNTLEKAVFKYDGKIRRSEFLQISGLKIIIDLSKPSGTRVTSILVESALRGPEKYEEINFNQTYKVILSEYIWDGGDGFKFDKQFKKFKSIGATNFEIIAKKIKNNSPISPEVDRRIILENANQIVANNSVPSSYFQGATIHYATACGNQP